METRFLRFVNNRRSRSVEAESELKCQAIPHQSSVPSKRLPIFLYQSLAKNASKSRDKSKLSGVPLRSFSYETCQPGKAPTFGTVPQKGNGPVKLQTSCRLSSGELITTTQDPRTTLQTIREGDYVVGRKDRPDSRAQGRSQTEPFLSPISHIDYSPVASPTSQTTPTASQTWPNSPCSPNASFASSRPNLMIEANASHGLGLYSRESRDFSNGVMYSDHHSTSHESTRSTHKPTRENSATWKALRKAEYSRLVELYGSDIAIGAVSTSSSPTRSSSSPVTLEPLPSPPAPADGLDSEFHRSSHASTNSDNSWAECSGSSSPRRVSCVSSCAESSVATGQTSIDEETATTRDEIRIMVEQMRLSYLSAFDSRATPAVKARPQRKTRKVRLMPSPDIVSSDSFNHSTPPVVGRLTWHPPNSEPDMIIRRRINSHPVSRHGRLSPIEASPRRKEDEEVGLERADSSTLGALVADLKKKKIQSRHTARARTDADIHTEARPRTPERGPNHDSKKDSWLNLESDSNDDTDLASFGTQSGIHSGSSHMSELRVLSPEIADDFDDLFSDFWTSRAPTYLEPTESPVVTATWHDDTYHTILTQPMYTMKRLPSIPSIPESPEYTHLATTNDADNNFI